MPRTTGKTTKPISDTKGPRQRPIERRVTFQNSDERKEELVRWREEQQGKCCNRRKESQDNLQTSLILHLEFRMILMKRELLQRESQHQSSRPAPNYKLVGWFIVLFLVVVPLLSNHDAETTSFNPNSSFRLSHNNSNHTTIPSSDKPGSAGDTFVVSVSHVDYTVVSAPKMLRLAFREMIASPYPCDSIKQAPDNLRVVKSHPLWTLQQDITTSADIISADAAPSGQSPFFVASIVRKGPDHTRNSTHQSNVTVLAISLLDETSKSTSRNRNYPIIFLQTTAVTADDQTSPEAKAAGDSTSKASYHIQVMSFIPCHEVSGMRNSTDIHKIGEKDGFPVFSKRLYSAPLSSLPSLRGLSTPPIPADNVQTNDTVVMFFGWDETYNETEYSYYTSQNVERENGKPNNYQWKTLRQSIPGLLPKKKEESHHSSTPLTLTLDSVPKFLQQLEERHGSVLRQSNPPYNRSIVLVVGSSVHDVLEFLQRATKHNESSTQHHDQRGGRRGRLITEGRDESLEAQVQGLDATKEGGDDDDIDYLEDSHLLACQEVIHRLQSVYPHVTLVWRLPLFVPGVPPTLWRAEGKLLQSSLDLIPAWDLYTASYVGWATQQQRPPETDESDYVRINYGPYFFQQVAQASRLRGD